ncbi:MAG: ATP-dependent zinc metalloprotease FtsH 2 [candidate division TM6 bacterium GW2011_GWE2_42_60]|nr:MAG: ATP-dependent zinc metalloprotease FtsH 2 [candidate division TM6 bacterium GW2011_GWE2_42_60]
MSKVVYSFLVSALVFFPCQAVLIDIVQDLALLAEINEQNRKAVVEKVYALFDQAKKAGASSEPETVQKSASPLRFSDLPGMPLEVREIVDFFKDSASYALVGARMPRGILLFGPPGTGKTSVARVIAHECGAQFFSACGSEFVEVYVGVGPKRVRELFEKAKKCEKAVIFIDEIDAIGGRRDERAAGNEYANTLNELLNQLDGFVHSENLLVIGATNRLDILDPALLRPGRFDRIVRIGVPSKEARLAILKRYCAEIPFKGDEASLDRLATQTEGWSGAELQNLVNEGAIRAARRKSSEVQEQDLLDAKAALKRH